jgi:hypothetical protein
MFRTLTALLAAALLLGVALTNTPATADEPGSQMAHMVFFNLKDSTPAAKQKLVAACRKYLSGHDGEVYFSTGARDEEMKREVNDTTFDVALHIVFRDKASYEKYSQAPRHLQFIAENKDGWAKVRVFDSWVNGK